MCCTFFIRTLHLVYDTRYACVSAHTNDDL